MPVTNTTLTVTIPPTEYETLMRDALRPCYIRGQLDSLRTKPTSDVTMGNALMFKGAWRDSYYVQRLASKADDPSKAVSYLLNFARRVCAAYGSTNLDDVVKSFRRDYDEAVRLRNEDLKANDKVAVENWDSFLATPIES